MNVGNYFCACMMNAEQQALLIQKVLFPEKPFLLIPLTHAQSTNTASTNNQESFAFCILPVANHE